jgi:hypothetical protein
VTGPEFCGSTHPDFESHTPCEPGQLVSTGAPLPDCAARDGAETADENASGESRSTLRLKGHSRRVKSCLVHSIRKVSDGGMSSCAASGAQSDG